MHQAVVLFVASNPAAPRTVTLDEEMRDLGRWLRPPSCPVGLTLRTCWTPRVDHIERALADAGQAIVHVSGRGVARAESPVADGVRLRELVGALAGRIRLVVLDGCDDDELADELAERVDCVVGVPAPTRARAATAFLGYFYLLLAHRRDPGEAFRVGMAATDLDGIERGRNPRLLFRNGVVASEIRLSPPSIPVGDVWMGPPSRCRMTVGLDGSPADLQGGRLTALKTLLREVADDATLLVETVADRELGLVIATTEAGRARLLASIESRQIVELDQLPIVSAETELLPDWQVERCTTDSTRLSGPERKADTQPRNSWLIVSWEDEQQPVSDMRLALDGADEVLIGRGPEAQCSRRIGLLTVTVPDRKVSRLHLRLERTVEGWSLSDVGSANGTLVNGYPVSRCALVDGDIIEISRAVLVFRENAA